MIVISNFCLGVILGCVATVVCSKLFEARVRRADMLKSEISQMALNENLKLVVKGEMSREETLAVIEKKMEILKVITKHSFKSMVFSLRPLKLKYWYTDEELKLIGYNNNK